MPIRRPFSTFYVLRSTFCSLRSTFYVLSSTFILFLSAPPPALAQSATPTPATAADGIRLTTSPLPLSLTAKPGTSVSVDIKVKNSGTHDEVLKAGLLTFSAHGENGNPQLRDRQAGDDFFDWVTFSPQQFEAPPNQWRTVKMTINVPTSAAFGYYYAVTFGRANPVKPANQEAAIIGATATLVLLNVDVPGAQRLITVQSFTADHPWFEFLPAGFSVRLHNAGNVHAAPFGTIYISSPGDPQTILSTIDINSAKGYILPDSNRIFSGSWLDGWPSYTVRTKNGQTVMDSHGKPVQYLNWDITKANQFRFGKYTAHLVMAYDNGIRDVPLEATTTFWIIPWRLLLAAVVVMVILGFGVYAMIRGLIGLVAGRRTAAI